MCVHKFIYSSLSKATFSHVLLFCFMILNFCIRNNFMDSQDFRHLKNFELFLKSQKCLRLQRFYKKSLWNSLKLSVLSRILKISWRIRSISAKNNLPFVAVKFLRGTVKQLAKNIFDNFCKSKNNNNKIPLKKIIKKKKVFFNTLTVAWHFHSHLRRQK